MMSRSIRKPLHPCYSADAREAVSKYNAAIDAADAVRRAAEAEREKIVAAALDGLDAAAIRARCDALRASLLDADVRELAAMRSLPEIEKPVKASWEAEAERLAGVAREREQATEKKMLKAGFTLDQIEVMVAEDEAWQQAEGERTAARSMVSAGIGDANDAIRRDELARSVEAAVLRMIG